MKKILSAALAIVLFATAAQAQKTDSAKHHRKGHEISKELSLTEAQKAKLKAIREEQRKEMETLKKADRVSREESISKRKELHDKYQAQVNAVLTTEQKERMARMKAERKEMGEHHKEMRKAGKKDFKGHKQGKKGRDGQFTQELNLSADQKAKMEKVRKSFKTEAESIRNDKSLNEEQRKEKMKSLKAEHKSQVQSILTKEQQEKIRAAKKDRKVKTKK